MNKIDKLTPTSWNCKEITGYVIKIGKVVYAHVEFIPKYPTFNVSLFGLVYGVDDSFVSNTPKIKEKETNKQVDCEYNNQYVIIINTSPLEEDTTYTFDWNYITNY